MKKSGSISGALAALCLLGAAVVATRAQTQDPPQFEEALPDGQTGNIRFTPFQNVDWKLLAHHEIKDVNIDHPTAEQFARLKKHYAEHASEEGSDELRFSSAIGPDLKEGMYYLISIRGMEPLDVVNLSGQFMFGLNQSRTALTGLTYSGNVVAKTRKEEPLEGGFVLHSASAVDFSRVDGKFAARKEGKKDIYDCEIAGKKMSLTVADEGLFQVVSAVLFKIGANEYVFVKWKPDTDCAYGCCAYRYSLFSVGDELKLLRSSLSGCDV